MSTQTQPAETSGAEDEAKAWLAENDRVYETISIECLAGGAFNVRKGELRTLGLGWDEMLGQIAAMTIPSGPARYCYVYPLTTDAEDAERERKLSEKRHEEPKN
jgi:hypothetical protein